MDDLANSHGADEAMTPAFSDCFFDLDGTLTDSAPGILNGVQLALAHFGLHPSRESLHFFIGPPLLESFARYFPDAPEKARTALRIYREYYRERGMFENSVYPGIRELLRDLRAAGVRAHLATAKPEPFALTIMEHFGLREEVCVLAGAELDGPRHDKTDVLCHALRCAALAPQARPLMIGDRRHDVAGAHAVGLPCAGVLYGYGSREELEGAGADSLCATVAELRGLLLPG